MRVSCTLFRKGSGRKEKEGGKCETHITDKYNVVGVTTSPLNRPHFMLVFIILCKYSTLPPLPPLYIYYLEYLQKQRLYCYYSIMFHLFFIAFIPCKLTPLPTFILIFAHFWYCSRKIKLPYEKYR